MKKFCLSIFVQLACYSFLLAQWQMTNGPFGGGIEIMTEENNILFASSSINGLYRSKDGGESWEVVSKTFFPNAKITALASNNGFVYVGTDGKGLYRSNDLGNTWSNIPIGGTSLAYIWSFTTIDTKLFACTNHSVYISLNNGDQWIKVDQGLPSFSNGLQMTSNNNILFAHNEEIGFYYSTNLGGTWNAINSPFTSSQQLTALCNKGNILYAGIYDFGRDSSFIYKTIDFGNTWSKAFILDKKEKANSLYLNDSNILCCASNGIFKSTDSGITWNSMSAELMSKYVNCIIAQNDSLFIGTMISGIFKSEDTGLTWFQKNNGIISLNCISFEKDDNNLNITTQGGALFTTDNAGYKWEPEISTWKFSDADFFAFNPLDTFTVYTLKNNIVDVRLAGTDDNIYKYNPILAEWNRNITPSTFYNVFCIINKGDSILIGTNIGIYYSIDKANTWNYLGLRDYNIYDIKFIGENIYAGTSFGIWWSFNNGLTWSDISNGGLFNGGRHIQQIDFIGSWIYIVTKFGLYKSNDNGLNWVLLGLNLDYPVSALYFDSLIIVATRDHGVFSSKNDGSSWDDIGSGLPTGIRINDIIYFDENLYIASNLLGVWKKELVESIVSIFSTSNTVVNDENINNVVDSGETISFDLNFINNGNVIIKDFTLYNQDILFNCDNLSEQLFPGDSVKCHSDYVIQQSDIDAGFKEIIVIISALGINDIPYNDSISIVVNLQQMPGLQLNTESIWVDSNLDENANVGELINYTIDFSNTGNVSLSNITITDILSGLNCQNFTGTLMPNQNFSCPGTYTITQDDYDAQIIINTVTIQGEDPNSNLLTFEKSDTILLPHTVATEVVKLNRIEIFPNPATSQIFISGIDENYAVEFINSLGEPYTLKKISNNYYDVSHLPSGLYFLIINSSIIDQQKVIIVSD